MNHEIDASRQKYPYCIVWSPLPPISWIFPFIGHTGIADSKGSEYLSSPVKGDRQNHSRWQNPTNSTDILTGVIFDFAGPFTINRGNFAFGKIWTIIGRPLDVHQKSWNANIPSFIRFRRSHEVHPTRLPKMQGYRLGHSYCTRLRRVLTTYAQHLLR